jgi:hypothetical protein
MGLLESWMFRRWPRPAQPASLVLELAALRLGPLGLGSPAQELADRLGPPASYSLMRKRGWWLYPELGLAFEAKDGQLIYLALISAHPETSLLQGFEARFRPFSGLVRLPRGTERLSSLQEPTFRELFGEPVDAVREPGESVVTFRVGNADVEPEFFPNGRLKHLALFRT